MISTELCRELARDLQDSLRNLWEERGEEIYVVLSMENLVYLLSRDALEELTKAIENALLASRESRDDLAKSLMRVSNSVGYVVRGVDVKTARKNDVYRLSLNEATKMINALREEESLGEFRCVGEFFAQELAACFWRMVSSS